MKRVQFACLILVFVVGTTWAGNTTINPGSERTLTQDPATGGSATDNGNSTFALVSMFDLDTKTIQAGSSTLATLSLGTGTASSQVFYEFQVGSTSETAGNTVGTWITYVVDWTGHQAVLAAGVSNTSVDIDLVLRDITAGSNLHFETIHALDLKTHKVKFVLLGLDFDDSGIKGSTIPAVLKRGHTYRLTLRMSATAFLLTVPGASAFAESYYAGTGVRLRSLNVKVGLDEKEVLQRLESFENHRHIYLTGRGEGHNNTEATSSLPIMAKPASPKLFLQTILEEDMPFLKPEAVPTDQPVFEKP